METLNFRTIAKEDLVEVGKLHKPMGYVYKRMSNSDFCFIFDIHIKRVRMSHGKKTVQTFMGMYVNVEGEKGLKMLVPFQLLSKSRSIYNFAEIIDADFFIGSDKMRYQIRFRNPRLLDDTGYVVCDVDYRVI